MNIVGIVLGVCILCSTTLGRKKRSPESDYWIQYEPIPQDQSKTDSRSEVSTNPQGDTNAVYQDTGYAQNAYPMPAVPQGPNNPVQQVPNPVAPISPSQPGQQVCHRALDLGIILDSSYTVEGVAWQDEKRTAQALIDKLDVNENGVRVGVMVFGTDVEIAVPFNGYKDVQELKQDIEDIDFMNGWSRTDLVLAAVRYHLFQSNGARDGIPKALVVFSDGRTDGESLPDRTVNWTERLKPAVEDLRRDGVNIFCIGVGDVDTTELKVIASDISSVFRPADLEMLVSKLNAISKQQCFNEKNIPSPPQCTTGCVVPSICLLAVQPTCLPPDQQTVTCTVPGSCTSTATTTATSTAVLTSTSTDIQTSTDVRILETVETQTKTALETSTLTTTATDTLTKTAVSTSTDYHTVTATQTNYVTETSTHTATSTQVHKTTETLSTTDIDTITSTHVATATKTAIATSTAIATRYVTSTRLTTSLDIDTSTHVTTATSTALETSTKTHVTTATDTSTAVTTATKTHVTTATDISTAVTTATKMKTLTTTSTALTTSTHLKNYVSTKVLTDIRTLTTTKTKLESSTRINTSTGFTTSTLFTTNTKTETNTAVVTSTALAVTTKVFTTTSTDLATSTHVTTATSTKIQTSTAIDTKTLTTVSTDVSTSTHVTTKTSTAVATKTSTAVVSVTKTQTKFTTATSTQVRTSTTTDTKTFTSTDVSTSTHVTTETSTAVATKTSTAVVSVTNTKTKFTTVTSTDVDTKVTTATSTKIDTSTTTDTKTVTTVSTDVSTSTLVTTRTSTAVVSVTDTKTQVQTITSTDVDTSTSIHVTTATITATKTSTAVATSTAVTTSTDTSTETKVVSTVKTTTESITKTKTRTSTVMSTSVVTSCSFNCPSASPTPTLTSVPPTSSSPTVKPATPAPEIPGCARDLDVGILLHVSENIPSQSFTTLKNFVAQFASKFPVSAIEAHFGLISYDRESLVEFKFSDAQYYNTDKLQEKIKSLHQMGSGSRIDLAFEKANEKLFSTSGGYRTYMPKTLVVFAEEGSGDGRKPYAQVIAPLVAKGVQIIAVGITNKVTREELKEIANGDERNVFLVNSFDEMSSIMKDLVQKSCDAPEPEPFHPPENVECKVEYKKLGCYKEQSSNPAMPERLLSKTPDWSDFASWLKEFVCQCAEKAKVMKYTVFGVRDSGECVSGPEAADVYLEYGESTNCVDGHFETCRKENKNECCGEKNTNYVYGVITEGKEITTPEPLTPTPTPTPAPCKAVVDLVFVMDGSSSIEHFGVGNFNRCKTFAKDMVNSFEVSQSGTHVSVVVFSSSASVIFALDEYFDIPSIDKAIDGIVYPEGGTYIGNALELTKSGVIDVSARTNVHRIIIVMTDGESSDDVTGPSQALKDAGNSLYVLGIGSSVNIRELNNMASDPDEDYVFRSGFDELDKAVKSIKEKACKEATKPLPTPEPVIVDANFTRTPPSIVYIRIGMTIRFVWEYHVSNRNTAFARYSPIWYYYSNGASVELASEDKNAAWLWSVSSSCPASYRGRISKEGQATLVIANVSETDAGYYGCSLMMVSGGPVLSKVQLVLLDARFTRTPPAVVYAYVGETVRLEWLYTVDGGRNNAFGLRSPTWTFYYSDVEYAELAFEDKNMGWEWSIAESCPASLRGRLTKESDATLVISQVSIADSGTYGCSLVMISGQPIISKIQLIVREKPKTEEFRVDFTKLPPREVYAYAGDDVKLEWEYKVTGDKNKGFARYSPTWNLYGEEGEATELAAEDKYSSWRWMVSSTCPASLRGRLRKESSAHLVISKVTIEDSGTYGCSLDLAFGEPLTDKVYLIVSERPTQRPTGEVTPPCKAVVDLVFLIDGSTSIEQFGMGNFKRCLNFAKTMVRNFDVSTQGTHVSVVMFTSKVQVEFTLTEYFDPTDIERAIDAIKYPGGSTFAGEGLKVVKNVLNATGRSNVPHALIIMTDGQSIDDIETPSSALKNDGTLIYCLGIGSDYNLQQLNTMASAPQSGHVFVADFDKLDTVVESIKQKACSDASRITPTITPATEHPATVKPEVKCKATVDLGFLIDGSTSIEMAGAGNFIRCKDFVKKMIANFDISQSGTHVGVAQFASRVFVNFTFNDYYDKGGLDKAVDDIPMLYGGTNLGKALKAVRTELFEKGSRSNISRILIVLSDGASEDDVDEPSKALRDQGITIFCLGIGPNKTNEQQLNIIASDPDSDHVFRSGFSELGNMVDLIERKACPDNPDFHIEGGVSSSSSYSYSNGYCSVRYNKIGCYGDNQKEPRPIPTQLFTDQNPDSDLFSGMTMNLGQWDQYMSDVVCRCAQHADNRDFKLFSIQNFGECWSGFDAEKTYSRNGESQSCISNKMEACDSRNQLLCVGNRTSNFVYEIDFGDGKQAEACSVTFEKVGCYKDNHGNPRPFSDLVSTDMDPKSQVYSGSPVNKGDWNTYLADVVCRCAQNTQEYEYEYFGIQNLGECWTGPTADRTYTLDGQSDQCLSKDMQACVIDSLDNCVGQENTNFVYRIQTADAEAFPGYD